MGSNPRPTGSPGWRGLGPNKLEAVQTSRVDSGEISTEADCFRESDVSTRLGYPPATSVFPLRVVWRLTAVLLPANRLTELIHLLEEIVDLAPLVVVLTDILDNLHNGGVA